MKKAGVYRVFLGIESGNQIVVNNIREGLRLEDVKEIITLLKKYKTDYWGYFILGLPQDTPSTMMDTVRFALDNHIKPHFHKTIAVPGTKLFEMVGNKISSKSLHRNASYSVAGNNLESYPGQANDLKRTLRIGYLRYFFHPSNLAQLLTEIRSNQDMRWIFNSLLRIVDFFR